eukprot:180999-Pleurochrysis_carterae.AAC.2
MSLTARAGTEQRVQTKHINIYKETDCTPTRDRTQSAQVRIQPYGSCSAGRKHRLKQPEYALEGRSA